MFIITKELEHIIRVKRVLEDDIFGFQIQLDEVFFTHAGAPVEDGVQVTGAQTRPEQIEPPKAYSASNR